ncbi:MAG TPA: hypothetical protein VJM10_02960 [Candidatus Methylomirabilis sp.]|nr:hypothetical protein [Candidatus Methylomirabilis sp.]
MGLADLVKKEPAPPKPGKELTEALTRIGSSKKVDPISAEQIKAKKNIFRASGVADLCAREEVLASVMNEVRDDTVTDVERTIFDTGTAIHDMVRGYLGNLGLLVGTWKCVICQQQYGELHKDRVAQPVKCQACKGSQFLYVEEHAEDKEYLIGGHCDGFLVLNGVKEPNAILEVKSIGATGMVKVVVEPYQKHIIQGQIYMWLFGFDRVKILYVAKDWVAVRMALPGIKSPFLEHDVMRDEVTIEAVKKKLKSVMDGITNQAVPARIMCASPNDWRAKECPMRGPCFAP